MLVLSGSNPNFCCRRTGNYLRGNREFPRANREGGIGPDVEGGDGGSLADRVDLEHSAEKPGVLHRKVERILGYLIGR
jgi:hypothetical protein